jgi:type IV fimbrial biogenesis protein FimT
MNPPRPRAADASLRALRRRQRGASLVEATVGAAVAAIVAGAALSAYDTLRERHAVRSAAGALESELQHARSVAVTHNRAVRLAFREDAGGSCWVLHTGAAGACECTSSGEASCTGPAEMLRSMPIAGRSAPRVTANVASMTFDPLKGTVTPTGTLRVRGALGTEMRLVVNVMGRTRSCTPNATLAGERAC